MKNYVLMIFFIFVSAVSLWFSNFTIVFAANPLGVLDEANCDAIAGWAGDPDNPYAPIAVHVYYDRFDASHIFSINADVAAAPAVCSSVSGQVSCSQCVDNNANSPAQCKHRFRISTPSYLKDGQPHTIYTFGINIAGTTGSNTQLLGAPKTFQCVASSPSPSPSPSQATRFIGYGLADNWQVIDPAAFAQKMADNKLNVTFIELNPCQYCACCAEPCHACLWQGAQFVKAQTFVNAMRAKKIWTIISILNNNPDATGRWGTDGYDYAGAVAWINQNIGSAYVIALAATETDCNLGAAWCNALLGGWTGKKMSFNSLATGFDYSYHKCDAALNSNTQFYSTDDQGCLSQVIIGSPGNVYLGCPNRTYIKNDVLKVLNGGQANYVYYGYSDNASCIDAATAGIGDALIAKQISCLSNDQCNAGQTCANYTCTSSDATPPASPANLRVT